MRRTPVFFLLMFLLSTLSCGGGGGSSSGGGSGVPELSVNFENPTSRRGETVYVTITWTDSDGDIAIFYTEEYYATARWDKDYPASEMGITGASGLSKLAMLTNSNASIGVHTFKFFVKDSKGQTSNIVTITSNMTAKENAKQEDTKIPMWNKPIKTP